MMSSLANMPELSKSPIFKWMSTDDYQCLVVQRTAQSG